MKTFNINIFIFLFTYAFGQDYKNYYLDCNLSDSLSYNQQNEQALIKLKEAFTKVDYVHSKNFVKAYHLAIKLKKYDEAFEFGKMIIINSGEKNKIITQSSEFKKTCYYKNLKDSIDEYTNKFNNRINHFYKSIIDSLYYIDQRIIRNNRSIKKKYKIISKSLPNDRFELDSVNWLILSKLIDSLGFPSEQNVGYETYSKASIIIHHNLRLEKNSRYHNRIFEFIKNGDYLPENFFFWYEQYQMQIIGNTFFTTWDKNTSTENLKRIDINRRAFYLKGINSYKIEKNGMSMISLW